MNIDLKSHYFMQSQFKASNNSLSKNVVTGFDQKKSEFHLEGDGKNLLKSDKKEKKENQNKDPYRDKKSDNETDIKEENQKIKVNKLMNVI